MSSMSPDNFLAALLACATALAALPPRVSGSPPRMSWLTVFLCLLDLPTPSWGRPLLSPASRTQA